MNPTAAQLFESQALAQGYQVVLDLRWEPDTVLTEHSHPFDAYALVLQGELWLTTAGTTQHITPGNSYRVQRGAAHSERYGAHGARTLMARRTL